jgi:NADH-quinone oxidoreductase subunit E
MAQPQTLKTGHAGLLSEASRRQIDGWVARFPEGRQRSAVIQALMVAQEQNGGFLTRELIEAVADYLQLPPVWAAEVASFYSMFDNQPVGRHKVNICTNISCWLNGAEDLVRHAEQKLGIAMGETTSDGRITLKIEEECLAACCGAPMMVVDGHYHERLDFAGFDRIIDGLD